MADYNLEAIANEDSNDRWHLNILVWMQQNVICRECQMTTYYWGISELFLRRFSVSIHDFHQTAQQ